MGLIDASAVGHDGRRSGDCVMSLLGIETGELVGVRKVVDYACTYGLKSGARLLCGMLRRRSGALIKRTWLIPLVIEK